jgi:hypothetical protein
MTTSWQARFLPFLIAVFVLDGCGRSAAPKPGPAADAGARPEIAESGPADVVVVDARADVASVQREDLAPGDLPPAADVPADIRPEADSRDQAGEDAAADLREVAVADEPPAPDLALPDSRDGKGEDTAMLDLGGDTDVGASPDQARRDLSPVDVQRPDLTISECAFYKTRSSLYVPPRFDFSLIQPDGASLSCATRFSDGGDPSWKQPVTGQISGWVTAVSANELRVDLCEPGKPCEPAEYRFTVSAPALTLPGIPIGRRITVSWWMQYGGWACPRMLVVTDDASSDAGAGAPAALWLAGVESMLDPKLPLPFAVGLQQLYCNSDPDAGRGCGGTDLLPDDYAFLFGAPSGETPLLLGTSQSGTLALTLGSGTVQHLSLYTLRSFVTGGCDDYWNWAWHATGHAGASGDPD